MVTNIRERQRNIEDALSTDIAPDRHRRMEADFELLKVPGVIQINAGKEGDVEKVTIDKDSDVPAARKAVVEIFKKYGIEFYAIEVLDRAAALKNSAHRRLVRAEGV